MTDSTHLTDPTSSSGGVAPHTPAPLPGLERDDVDLDAVERDLDDVHTALGRLDDGSYWTDEVTGEPIPDQVLADHPTARRAT